MKWLVSNHQWVNLEKVEKIDFRHGYVNLIFADGYLRIEDIMPEIESQFELFLKKPDWLIFCADEWRQSNEMDKAS